MTISAERGRNGWRSALGRLAVDIEQRADRVRHAVAERFGRDPLRIAGYRGFGTPDRVHLLGRVLDDEGLRPGAAGDSPVANLVATLRRFESDERRGARVIARIGGAEREAVTDEEGYFQVTLAPALPLATVHPWHDATVELIEPRRRPPVTATVPVLIPAESAQFGVISDLDDTVLRTDATSLLRLARTVLFGNAHTREPFEGVAAFYTALRQGAGGAEGNPLFYVSSSPWNLYELLVEFLELRQVPLGPLLLRDWGLDADVFHPRRHAPHKLAAVERVLGTYPALPFVLIGDSGQEDPEIYREVVARHPDRVRAIYIREVAPSPGRRRAIAALARETAAAGVDLVLGADTAVAVRHAETRGWIRPAPAAVGA